MCEYPEFYREKEQTARKRHGCHVCGGPIEPGMRYMAFSGKWEGEFMSGALHLSCLYWYGEMVRCSDPMDCNYWEDTWEWMQEAGVISSIAHLVYRKAS